jgi:ribonuclease D
MFQKTINKEEINILPVAKFEGEIVIVENYESAKKVASILKKHKVIGFDTETRPSFKKGRKNRVALLQLATNKSAFLIRLNKIGLPDCIIHVLTDETIIKIGVAIKDDILTLQSLRHFEPQSFVDLQKYVKKFEIENASLRSLSAIVLKVKISKRQQLSNWENEVLTDAQKEYAATDAWAGRAIYQELNNLEIGS